MIQIHFDQRTAEGRSLAYHEAGHAVIAQSLGIRVFYACVVPRYGDGGHVSLAGLATMTMQDALLITLAGPAAQRRYFPLQQEFSDDLADEMGRFDTAQARTLLSVSRGADQTQVLSEATARDLARWRERADRAVAIHWEWITAVARALEYRQRVSGDEIAALNPVAHQSSRTYGRAMGHLIARSGAAR
jgi:hypothetical protein